MTNTTVNLTRARKVLRVLTDIMENHECISTTSIGYHLDAQQAVEQFNLFKKPGDQKISDHLANLRAVFDLRFLISQANNTCGLDQLMNQQRRLMLEHSFFETIVSRGSKLMSDSEFVIKFNYDAQKPSTRGYGSSSSTGLGCSSLSTDVVQQATNEVKSIKKQLMQIEDKITMLNSSTLITLSDSINKVLLQHDLI